MVGDFPCEGRHNKKKNVCLQPKRKLNAEADPTTIGFPDLGFPATRVMRNEFLWHT